MFLVFHFLKKDIRRSRLLLLFWFALILLEYGLCAYGVHPGDPRARIATTLAVTMVMPLRVLFSAILIGLIVQEDAPTGTTAFWLTRPVFRSSVLVTKLIALASMVLVPIVAELVVLRLAGFVRHDLALALPEIALEEVQIALWAGVVAALTPNFARFGIMAIALFVAAHLFEMAGDWIRSFSTTTNEVRAAQLWPSIATVRAVVMIAGLGAMLAYQFMRRRTRPALVGVLATIVASSVISWSWKWDFIGRDRTEASLPKLDVASVHTTLRETDTGDESNDGPRPHEAWKSLSASLTVQGIPTNRMILTRHVTATFTSRSGQPLTVAESQSSRWLDSPNSSSIAEALGHVFVYGRSWEEQAFHSPLARFEASEFRRHAQEPLKMSAILDLEVDRFVVTGRAPLVRGASIRHGSQQLYVTDVLRNGRGLDVLVEERRPTLLFGIPAGEDSTTRYLSVPELSIGRRFYVIANAKNREVVRVRNNGGGATQIGGFQSGISRFAQRQWQLSFGPNNYAPIPDLDDVWLASAELVELSLQPVGLLTQSLTSDPFILEGPNKDVKADETTPRTDTDPEWLTRFTLSEHPTKAEVRKYVSNLATALPYWRSASHADLPLDLLVKIGPGNADVVLEMLTNYAEEWSIRNTLLVALLRTAGPEDKPAVLRALPTYPQLADLVVKYHWETECRAELLKGITDGKSLPRNWIVAVAALHDPSTYPALKQYFVNTDSRWQTYEVIKKLPGIDLGSTIVEAWHRASASAHSEKLDAAPFAVDAGILPALGVLVDELRNHEVADPDHIKWVLGIVERVTPATGGATDVVQWYDTNKDHLAYDEASRKFLPAREHKS